MFVDRRLWEFTEGVRGRIVLAVLAGVLAAMVGILRLGLLGWLIAALYRGAGLEELGPAAALVAAVMVLRGALEHWRTMIAHRTAAHVQLALRERLFDQVVRLGPAYFGLERTGEVLLSVVEGVEQLETWFGQYLPQLFVSALTPFVVFAVMAFVDLPTACILLAFAMVSLVAPSAFHRWDVRNSVRRQHAYSAFAAEFLDAIQGLATLKAFGQGTQRGRLLAERAHEVFRTTMWVLATNTLTRGITDVAIAVGAAVALGFGAWRVSGGTMELTALLVVLMMGIEVFRPQRELRELLHQGMIGQSAAQGILQVLDAAPVIEPNLQAPRVEAMPATLRFEEVAFTYPGGRRQAHRRLDFAVAEGERVGFVGASGAGKTTIVRLLMRFYDPDSGAVYVGGRDLRSLHPEDLHRQIAVVNQDTCLFHGTVEDNLRLGKPDAGAAELEAAARAANAHEFIVRLPQGYETVVGERGIRLSGGQRQRIAIARALLRDAPILVLDEALSAVDAQNEAVIQEALDRLMHGRTSLIFAHRLSSVIGADRILVLDEGAVAESGTHRELMARRGHYHALMSGQAEEGASVDEALRTLDGAGVPPPEGGDPAPAAPGSRPEPDDAIVEAQGMGWFAAFRELFAYVVPWKGKLAATFSFGVLRVLCLIGVGVLSALTVAAVKTGEPYAGYLVALGVVAPFAGILHWLESWFAHDMAFRLLAEMRIALFRKLDKLAPAYLVRRRTGDLVAMATHDVELVEYFFAHTVAPAFVAVLVPLAVLGVLFHYGWLLALVLVPFLVVVGLSPVLSRRRLDALGSRAREALGNLNAHTVDTIQGLSEIAAFQHAAVRRAQFVERVNRHLDLRLPFFRDLTFQKALLETATGLGGLVVVVAAVHATHRGGLASELVPLLTLLAMSAFLPVSEIAQIGRQLADTLGSTRRLHAVRTEEVAVADGPGAEPVAGASALEFEHVDFEYLSGRPVLRDVSFRVAAGRTIALVGPSGAGKTTAAHLLLRFWDPGAGTVRMHGQPLPRYRLDTLREQIALVSQDTYLFNETLRGNILMARPEASGEALAEAVARASLDDFVQALPEGLDTRVGERGMRLSGGQRQRVAIARAFLKDAPILVLDEATSHLDALNEGVVRHALEDLMDRRTTVVIAHRLSTVRDADTIVVLDEGRVVEQGTHRALMRNGGLYRHLVAHQLTSDAAGPGTRLPAPPPAAAGRSKVSPRAAGKR